MRITFSGAIVAALAGIAPIVVFGHSYGPPPGVTAAPGDNARACTLCHAGQLNTGKGSVKILLQSGPVYIPGVKQRVAVQVSDPVQKRWGFEMTARLNSDLANAPAGNFIPVDNMTQVICEDNAPQPCASGPTFITHTSAGTRLGTTGGATFQFDWTPPATDVGPVTLYVAANAANGDANFTGDFIYTSNVVLTAANPAAPSVATGSIVSSATMAPGAVSPNSWVTIYGDNLGVTTRSWTDGDFLNGGMPFSLDGVSVVLTLFGAPRLAYVGYVSPTQVNFLLPSDLLVSPTTVQVRNPAGISKAISMTVQANACQLFTLDGKNVFGTHADGTYIGKSGILPSSTTTPAAPGETVTIVGTGLGATSPALIPGQLPVAPASLATPPKVSIGGASATVISAGIVPGAAGQYLINVQVPSNAVDGDLPLIVQIGNTSSVAVTITVQK